jgi:hypothetical protein
MSNHPDVPEECPLCKRVEVKILSLPMIAERLSENEIKALIEEIQSAILNKEITKTTRGMKMADDDKYVISKASFEDFYETQETLVSIIEKMVDRIEKQDHVIMKYGAALSDIMSKLPEEEEYAEEEVEDVEDEEEPVADEVEGIEEDEEEDAEAVDAEEEPILEGAEEELPVAMGKMPMGKSTERMAFEAGFKAALAEVQKNGVPVTKVGEKTAMPRPVSTVDANNAMAANGLAKTLNDADLAKMSPQQLNTWLKENKL